MLVRAVRCLCERGSIMALPPPAQKWLRAKLLFRLMVNLSATADRPSVSPMMRKSPAISSTNFSKA